MLEEVAKGTCPPPHSLTKRLGKMKYEDDHQFEFSVATAYRFEQLPTTGARFKIITLMKIPVVIFTFPQRTPSGHRDYFGDGRFGRLYQGLGVPIGRRFSLNMDSRIA